MSGTHDATVGGWHGLEAGDPVFETTFGPLTVTDFVRYQGASGDMNPIHHDSEFAAHAGYDRPLAVGMLQAGVLAGHATAVLGASNIRSFKVQFREVAWPGDILTLTASVSARSDEDGTLDLDMYAHRPGGGLHARAWATFVLPGEAVSV